MGSGHDGIPSLERQKNKRWDIESQSYISTENIMKPYWFKITNKGAILLSTTHVEDYNVVGANSIEEAIDWIEKTIVIDKPIKSIESSNPDTAIERHSSVSTYQWEQMVRKLAKPGIEILKELTDSRIDLLHAAVGVSGEAGELLDAIKKHVIYNRPIDLENIIEELGDIEFYLEQLRGNTGVLITREATLKANYEKLSKRYKSGTYSDSQAQKRADKVDDTKA